MKPRVFGDEADLARIIPFVLSKHGIDLGYYRQSFLFRHLRGRLQDTGCKNSSEYIERLKNDPEEFKSFLETLSINVTHFFRDIEVFDTFRKLVVPELVKRKESGDRAVIRVWSAGCASGQETYSLAILFREALGPGAQVKIVGTDVDSDALNRAQAGEYDERDFRETDKKLLDKYFEPVYNKVYRVNDEIRRFVRFEKNNLITDEPVKHVDAVFCRNVLIYFNHAQQELIFSKFSSALNARGFLVLAKVETIWDKSVFLPVDLNCKIYRKAAS